MEAYQHCQSCGMPLDQPEVLGTEKNGSKSHDYCYHCYIDGKFTNPDITPDEMKLHLQERMRRMNMDEYTITEIIRNLPQLNRWAVRPLQHSK